MIKIDYLKHYPDSIPELVTIWHETLGKIWLPDVCITRVEENLKNHLNTDELPFTLVALSDNRPVGMCSLRVNDGIRPDLLPWLGSLVVTPDMQKQGIGNLLIDEIKKKAQQLGFKTLYLLAFDLTIPDYYQRLGWSKIGTDNLKGHPVTVMQISLK